MDGVDDSSAIDGPIWVAAGGGAIAVGAIAGGAIAGAIEGSIDESTDGDAIIDDVAADDIDIAGSECSDVVPAVVVMEAIDWLAGTNESDSIDEMDIGTGSDCTEAPAADETVAIDVEVAIDCPFDALLAFLHWWSMPWRVGVRRRSDLFTGMKVLQLEHQKACNLMFKIWIWWIDPSTIVKFTVCGTVLLLVLRILQIKMHLYEWFMTKD